MNALIDNISIIVKFTPYNGYPTYRSEICSVTLFTFKNSPKNPASVRNERDIFNGMMEC